MRKHNPIKLPRRAPAGMNQRRAAMKARRLARCALVQASTRLAIPACAIGEALPVGPIFRADSSFSAPDFIERGCYLPKSFTCKDCGKAETWTAAQQKWWYETAGGDVWTTACRCRPCRIRERARVAAAREATLAGYLRKLARLAGN